MSFDWPHTRCRDFAGRPARAVRWLRRTFTRASSYYDAAAPPPEEHSFTLVRGESLAVLRFSPHGHDLWTALHNSTLGPTVLEAGGPAGHAPTRETLAVRLPIEAASAWADAHRYDPSTRPDARYGTLMLTTRPDRRDLQVLYIRASTRSDADDPVNQLLDAFYSVAFRE